jgi:tRNA(fMet)-specific endonuclease VapC
MFGLARRPDAARMHQTVAEFLRRVDVLPWDSACAAVHGPLRAALGSHGKSLSPLDLLIAAQAQATGATLVSNDQAFRHVAGIAWEDWTV